MNIRDHDCLKSIQGRMAKLSKTLDYVHGRIVQQEQAKRRFEFVLQMVKKKTMSHNKRVDQLINQTFSAA